MKSISKRSFLDRWTIIVPVVILGIFLGFATLASQVYAASEEPQPVAGEHLITIHDEGKERGILTRASTLREAFEGANIPIDPSDRVEPGLDEPLVTSNYEVNIYRARPVTIVDGSVRIKVMSAYQTPQQIADQAGVTLHDEDTTKLSVSDDIVADGSGLQMEVDRATSFTLVLYGKSTTAYTKASTVGEMLDQKHVSLASEDTLSVAKNMPITEGMTVELWRNGVQTITEDKEIPFETEKVKDADHDVGYKEVKTPGQNGKKTVTYEIEMKNGKEIGRKEIQSVVSEEPKKQVEIIGTKVDLPAGSHTDWMAAAGISASDYGYVDFIISHESGWRPGAVSPNGYYGLGQTNLNSISSACPNWQSDPVCQLRFFTGYANRYGGWAGSYDFWKQHSWW